MSTCVLQRNIIHYSVSTIHAGILKLSATGPSAVGRVMNNLDNRAEFVIFYLNSVPFEAMLFKIQH